MFSEADRLSSPRALPLEPSGGDERRMLRSWLSMPFDRISRVAFAIDFILIVGTSVLTEALYRRLFLGMDGELPTYFGIGILFFANYSTLLASWNDYRPVILMNFWRQLRDVSSAWILTCFLLLVVCFALKISDELSRGATITFFALGWINVVVWRCLFANFLARALANGAFAERKVIVIAEENQMSVSRALGDLQRCGYKPIRTFVLHQADIDASGIPRTMRATLSDVIETARNDRVEDIFLLIRWHHRRCIEHVLDILNVLPLPVHLVPDTDISSLLASPIAHVGTGWTAQIKRAPLSSGEQFVKRGVDIFGALLGLIMAMPLLLVVALAIKLESPGPVLFKQARNGFSGLRFRIFKFRTMRVLEDGPVIRQATRNDHRVTFIGRILRRTSIDELPQLLNVLLGDMSLVGPRPHAEAHNSEYEKLIANYAFRHHVKPGITGWAQINGFRGETITLDAMAKRVELDLWYINKWTLWLDIRIMFQTLLVGMQRNAY